MQGSKAALDVGVSERLAEQQGTLPARTDPTGRHIPAATPLQVAHYISNGTQDLVGQSLTLSNTSSQGGTK